MGRRKDKDARRAVQRFITIGTLLCVLFFVAVLAGLTYGWRSCTAFEEQARRAAAGALGVRPDVAAIVSAREAVREAARVTGLRQPIVKALAERRGGATGEEHVLLVHVHSKACDAEYEGALGRLLSKDELAALDQAAIWERTTTR